MVFTISWTKGSRILLTPWGSLYAVDNVNIVYNIACIFLKHYLQTWKKFYHRYRRFHVGLISDIRNVSLVYNLVCVLLKHTDRFVTEISKLISQFQVEILTEKLFLFIRLWVRRKNSGSLFCTTFGCVLCVFATELFLQSLKSMSLCCTCYGREYGFLMRVIAPDLEVCLYFTVHWHGMLKLLGVAYDV